MLAFIDESGDSGFKFSQGSSRFFVIVLIVFEDNEDALACDKRITVLRQELGWKSSSEFHFKRNSDFIRKTFLKEMSKYNFFYYAFVLDKSSKRLYGDVFKEKKSFYKYICGLIFENAKDKLLGATVTLDESGSLEFKAQLAKYIKIKMNSKRRTLVKKVKMQKSSSNNLLQLADYVAGAVGRSISSKKDSSYRFLISHREISVQVWPK